MIYDGNSIYKWSRYPHFRKAPFGNHDSICWFRWFPARKLDRKVKQSMSIQAIWLPFAMKKTKKRFETTSYVHILAASEHVLHHFQWMFRSPRKIEFNGLIPSIKFRHSVSCFPPGATIQASRTESMLVVFPLKGLSNEAYIIAETTVPHRKFKKYENNSCVASTCLSLSLPLCYLSISPLNFGWLNMCLSMS